MNNKITFYIDDKDKEIIKGVAKEQGLPVASFCRFFILNKLKTETASPRNESVSVKLDAQNE